jgi:hypothetical protein
MPPISDFPAHSTISKAGGSVGVRRDAGQVMERRWTKRHRVIRSVHVQVGAVALDISSGGARICFSREIDPIDLAGSDVVLHLPFGTSLPARVCWRTDTDVGFEFDHACFIPFELPQQGQHQTAPVG